jgi:DNA-binding transcriptional regulator LsrR (DeoR family)
MVKNSHFQLGNAGHFNGNQNRSNQTALSWGTGITSGVQKVSIMKRLNLRVICALGSAAQKLNLAMPGLVRHLFLYTVVRCANK